jgi:hypothetical protein
MTTKEIEVKSKALDADFTAFIDYAKQPSLAIELRMNNYVDGHEYHDSPSSIDIWLTEEELNKLINELTQCKVNMKKLKEASNG